MTRAKSSRSPDLPELEQLMLHRLAELDQLVRESYDAFDFKKIARALIDFANVELSAFYFDVRKDALYCDAPSSLRRRSALHVIRTIFDCMVTWLAPMLPFTTEEAWLSRNPSAVSVHLEQFPTIPAEWKNDALAEKWKKIRAVRTRRHRRARNRAQGQAHRLVAGSGPGRLRRRCGAPEGAGRPGFRGDLHHLRHR